jgi:hypothetical protein
MICKIYEMNNYVNTCNYSSFKPAKLHTIQDLIKLKIQYNLFCQVLKMVAGVNVEKLTLRLLITIHT